MMSKRKKVKLPKRIAGVKVPKAARKGPVADFLNSSGGQVLLAEALVLAAGVFGVRRLSTPLGISEGFGMRENIADASARLSYACGEALRAFRAALEESAPVVAQTSDDSDLTHSEDLPEGLDQERVTAAKKKRATSRSNASVAAS
jgi:hypothetical protein